MIKAILITLLIITFLLWLLIHFVIPYKFIHPVQKEIPEMVEANDITYHKLKVNIGNEHFVAGYHLHPAIKSTKNDTALLILHGISGAKEKFMGIANFISRAGYTAFVFDLRMHGESTGKHFTYGHEEKKDISKIIDTILGIHSNYTIGILGHSMGGAIAAQSLAYDDRLSFGIIQSSFRELREIVQDYGDRLSKNFSPRFLVNYVLNRAGKMGGFNPSEISPVRSLEQVQVPVLISHGNQDDKIKFEYGQDLYDRASSNHKVFYPIVGGKHEGVLIVGGEKYFSEIVSFMNSLTNLDTQ